MQSTSTDELDDYELRQRQLCIDQDNERNKMNEGQDLVCEANKYE